MNASEVKSAHMEQKTMPATSEAPKLAANERPHHPYSPSSLQAREACPQYVPRSEATEASLAGTKQHEAFESRDLSQLTDEQADAVERCLAIFDALVANYAAGFGQSPIIVQEEYLPVDLDEDVSSGYLDVAVVAPDHSCADLIDLKFGRWPVEPAKNNVQGICYALGLFWKFPKLQTIRVTFLMPYLDDFSKLGEEGNPFQCEWSRSDMPAMLLRVRTIVARAKSPTSKPCATTGTCVFCARVGECPVVGDIALKVAHKYDPLSVPEEINSAFLSDPNQNGVIMKITDLVKTWAEATRRRLTDKALAADAPPVGYHFKESSRRKIKDKKKLRDIAQRVLTPEQFLECCDILFGPLEDFISAQAPRGSKKASVQAFGDTLLLEGAVEKGDKFVYLEMDRTTH